MEHVVVYQTTAAIEQCCADRLSATQNCQRDRNRGNEFVPMLDDAAPEWMPADSTGLKRRGVRQLMFR